MKNGLIPVYVATQLFITSWAIPRRFFLLSRENVMYVRKLFDIVNKGLPNRVLSSHLRFVWLVERSA